jgi:lipopolysaccharide export LptBFGC system permease protein LptF
MALLAATLALFDNGIVRPRAKYLIIFLSGYAAYSMVKLFVTMGELGFLPAVAAAWGGPLLIVVTIAALQLMMRRKII